MPGAPRRGRGSALRLHLAGRPRRLKPAAPGPGAAASPPELAEAARPGVTRLSEVWEAGLGSEGSECPEVLRSRPALART